MTGLAEVVAGWPFAASMAVAMTAQTLRAGRRRGALNEALHELRRPLQAVALAAGPEPSRPESVGESVRLAALALERLERQINGGPLDSVREAVACRPLLRSAVRRWSGRAALGGGRLELRWRAGEAVVSGDRAELAQALDNLIVNAIEHGGPRIAVEACLRRELLRISVRDSGRASRPAARRETPREAIARLSGRRRHGHGLAVVRRVAASHGGRFSLRGSGQGTTAVLELPLSVEPVGERRVTPGAA